MKDLKSYVRTIPDFPKEGIMFRDVTTLFGNPAAFRHAVDALAAPFKHDRIDKVAGIEARGFILAGAVAHRLSAGFVPIRKEGKLPHQTLSEGYVLEYGEATLEMHLDAFEPGERILLVDDLLATGGTAVAALSLLERLGGDVIGCSFIIDLPDLGGREKLEAMGEKVVTLVEFDGD
ncbi:adenine phosphoribosyltransferase [Kordiimonas marina]|uniref:adenine phosphoribosyltransferase n=1 Tax=Kordiimonas marina TaxID=2872312 RepID=UPI001FF0EE24|nr:adenine phosphoribosyltransferase [Kordiimonas marina]MCJ9428000.1 adenine phosphoribosyltransferase [Kordiimonas marina]